MHPLLPIVLLLLPSFAHAYLDPGTGSLLVQGIIAGIATALGFVSLYWNKFKALFGRNKENKPPEDTL